MKIGELIYPAWWYFQVAIFRKKKPLQSVVFITDECNLRCKHCMLQQVANHNVKNMEQIRRDLEECYKMGSRFIDFEGGEVSLWRDGDKRINDVIDMAHEIGFYTCTITTNGQFPIRGTHADSLWVSMDGVGKYHDDIRGEGTFARLEKNIAESGCKDLSVNMVVNSRNYENVDEAIEYVRNNPHIKSISINFHTPFEGTEQLYLDPEIRRNIIDRVIGYKKKGYPIMNSVSGLKYMRMVDGKDYSKDGSFEPPFKKYCWVTNFMFPDGRKLDRCMGEYYKVCHKCGFCMGGEMAAVFNMKIDTILSGLKLRMK